MTVFHLARAKDEDLLEIVGIVFKAFGQDQMALDFCIGRDTPEGHQNLANIWLKFMQRNPGDHWVKVVEDTSGRIVGATNFRIHPTVVPDHSLEVNKEFSWLQADPQKLEMATKFADHAIKDMKRLQTQPYIVGSMMVQWGCKLADQLVLPMWVTSKFQTQPFYLRSGFADVEVNGQFHKMKRIATAK
ncbi:hypothetical protein ANO11243_091270 [Dothideomycetidae sp. 11243]|nr:hypothetical protein ANO11243_091270 [fungal sp. No.11243]